MLERISKKIGVTKTEIKILVFMLVVFISGFIYKSFIARTEEVKFNVYDYSDEDAKFYNSKTDSVKSEQSVDDYKKDILNFESKNFKEITKKVIPKENSINLNTASENELVNLPGIGEKTAKKIVEYRKQIKKFTNINQLLNVKGIGNSKLNKIKKFISLN
ncbi:MAG: helix-hairpin-helix domain-containing protein [Ignavibacteriales bacterium]|nr:helix-hairpin-helix domain-containing protein [Ignavibacteriales bacterium]